MYNILFIEQNKYLKKRFIRLLFGLYAYYEMKYNKGGIPLIRMLQKYLLIHINEYLLYTFHFKFNGFVTVY